LENQLSYTILFYIFSTLAVLGAVMVVSHKNPVLSAISLVLTLFSTAVLFVLLHAHFIAAIQILIYAGAIMVLFLFTVMFLNIREKEFRFDSINIQKRMTFLFIFLVVVGLLASRLFSSSPVVFSKLKDPENFGTVAEVGRSLLSDYLLAFELASVLVVVAMVGVVIIAKGRES